MNRRHRIAIVAANVFVLVCFASGCKKEEEEQAKVPTIDEGIAAVKDSAAAAKDSVTAAAQLAAADLHDGKADKVVSECLMCGLRMKGSADHASTYEGVSLHFCKDGCKTHFDEDPAAALLALEL